MWDWLRKDLRVAWINFSSTKRVYTRYVRSQSRPMTEAEIKAVDAFLAKVDGAFDDLDKAFGDWRL